MIKIPQSVNLNVISENRIFLKYAHILYLILFACRVILHAFCRHLSFPQNENIPWMPLPYRLDADQARRYVGPDLGPNCLQRLSVDDTSMKRVNPKASLDAGR